MVGTPDVGVALDGRRVRAWITYDWANSAFVTTVVAAVLPVYFSEVAGATLPSAASATQIFSLTTSIALAVTAVLSPVLGAYADLAGAKKRILGAGVAVGAVGTGALWLVGEGDWLLAAVLFGFGRVAFGTANVMYDSLLPHVATPEQQDRVSATGYAIGYLGGGLLLVANVAMILLLPDEGLGARLSFLTVAAWWAAFSLPLFRRVPEPAPTMQAEGGDTGEAVGRRVRATFRQVRRLVADLRHLQDLRRYLVAFLVYNDGINAVIAVAALYGVELGFDSTDLLLAILLVQFTGVPYSLLFGRLPSRTGARRTHVAAYLVLNIVLVPAVGIGARLVGPASLVSGSALGPIILLVGLQAVIGLVVLAAGRWFAPLAAWLDTRRSIQLALVAYLVIAVWGFALETEVEFWALAWLVSVVQGGSQALSRSLYAALVPDRRSGEFFGLFSILSKFASFLSPLLFVVSVAIFDSSRPAVLSLGVLFATGIWLLAGVDVPRGRARATTALPS